jgi:hypothetical protein
LHWRGADGGMVGAAGDEAGGVGSCGVEVMA